MAIIKKDNNVTTLINVFTVDPSNQQRLINILIETTEQVMNKQEGFISANIHKSLDGTHVVNYAQWESKEAFEKMLKNPKAVVHMNEVLSITKSVDGSLYEVAFVEEGTSNT
jgi:quinol monooxygenase YgiN